MDMKEREIRYTDPKNLIPYENNPRDTGCLLRM